jgi:hypothetical protein
MKRSEQVKILEKQGDIQLIRNRTVYNTDSLEFYRDLFTLKVGDVEVCKPEHRPKCIVSYLKTMLKNRIEQRKYRLAIVSDEQEYLTKSIKEMEKLQCLVNSASK